MKNLQVRFALNANIQKKNHLQDNIDAMNYAYNTTRALPAFNEDGSYTARAGKIIAGTPMGRFGNPEELIGAALFLASDDASGFVNGIVLPVDGGYSAYSGV